MKRRVILFLKNKKASWFLVVAINLVAVACHEQKEIGYFEDGEIRYQVELEGGKRHGKLIQYYPNGATEIVSSWRNGKKHGEVVSYYRNGNIKTKEIYANDRAWGEFTAYDSVGNIEEKLNFVDGKKEGEYVGFYASGDTMIVGGYHNDKKHGKATIYYEGGEVKDKVIYDKDSIIYNVSYTKGGAFYNESVILPLFFSLEDDSLKISLLRTFYNSARVGVAIGKLDESNKLVDTVKVLGSMNTSIEYSLEDMEKSTGGIEGIFYEIDASEDIIKAQRPFSYEFD